MKLTKICKNVKFPHRLTAFFGKLRKKKSGMQHIHARSLALALYLFGVSSSHRSTGTILRIFCSICSLHTNMA